MYGIPKKTAKAAKKSPTPIENKKTNIMGIKKNIEVIGGIYRNTTITIINAIRENKVLKKEKQIFEIGKIVTGSFTFFINDAFPITDI